VNSQPSSGRAVVPDDGHAGKRTVKIVLVTLAVVFALGVLGGAGAI